MTADALRDRIARAIESVAHEPPGGRPCELCVETADAVLTALADADPVDLGFKWVDGITYCTFHDATVTAERARTGACDRAHHFCAEVPVYARPLPGGDPVTADALRDRIAQAVHEEQPVDAVLAVLADADPTDDLWGLVWRRLGTARPRPEETTDE